MSSPLDRYKKWCAENPERFQGAQDFAQSKMGWTLPEIREKLRKLDVWLEVNANNKKANKRDWYRFVVNWLCRRFPEKTASPQPRTASIPEDKPRRSGVSNYAPQAVENFLGRVFKTDSMLIPQQTTKPESMKQMQARGVPMPPIRVITNKCDKCGSSSIPMLHSYHGQKLCGLCRAKEEE